MLFPEFMIGSCPSERQSFFFTMFSSQKAWRSETWAELLEETVVGWLLAVVVRGCDGIEVTPSPASSENGLNTMSIAICSLVRGGNNLDDGVSKANTSRSSL